MSRLIPGRSCEDCASIYEAFLRIPSDAKLENQDVADEFDVVPGKAENAETFQLSVTKEIQELGEGKGKEGVGDKEGVGQLISFNSCISTKGCIK